MSEGLEYVPSEFEQWMQRKLQKLDREIQDKTATARSLKNTIDGEWNGFHFKDRDKWRDKFYQHLAMQPRR